LQGFASDRRGYPRHESDDHGESADEEDDEMPWQVTQVQKALRGADYPMTGEQLAELAKRNGADEGLVAELREIDREVDGPNGVMKELKGELGGRTPGPHKSEEHHYKQAKEPRFQPKDVQRYLRGADYPMDGRELAELARRNGAPDELVETLAQLGEANGPTGVMQQIEDHLGGPPEHVTR
jgi:hypothetical protein